MASDATTPTDTSAEEWQGERISPDPDPGEQQTLPEMAMGEPEPEDEDEQPSQDLPAQAVSAEELLGETGPGESSAQIVARQDDERLKAVLEAIIYVTDEPLSVDQIAQATEQPKERISALLDALAAEYDQRDRGLSIKVVAGGYKMATKPEHHDAVRRFVKNLNPPLKLSLPALETLAVIAYKQPITAPEIMEIRGVQGAGVLKTLIDRKLIATAGRKQVVGKPILYKTTREFLVQFGLRDLSELPTLKEFQEIGRMDTGIAEERGDDAPAPAPLSARSEPGSPAVEPPSEPEVVPEREPGDDEPTENDPPLNVPPGEEPPPRDEPSAPVPPYEESSARKG